MALSESVVLPLLLAAIILMVGFPQWAAVTLCQAAGEDYSMYVEGVNDPALNEPSLVEEKHAVAAAVKEVNEELKRAGQPFHEWVNPNFHFFIGFHEEGVEITADHVVEVQVLIELFKPVTTDTLYTIKDIHLCAAGKNLDNAAREERIDELVAKLFHELEQRSHGFKGVAAIKQNLKDRLAKFASNTRKEAVNEEHYGDTVFVVKFGPTTPTQPTFN